MARPDQTSITAGGRAAARASLLVVVVLLSALAATAHADALANPTHPVAHERLKQGNRYYRLREFEKAIEEYKAGAARESKPVFHYNLGQCYRKLGRHDEALWHYELFVRHGKPTGELETVVQGFIAEMKSEIEKAAKPPPAPPVEPAPLAPPPPSSAAGGGTASPVRALDAGAGASAAPESSLAAHDTGALWSTRRKLAVVTASGGVLALAAGGVLGVSARNKQRDSHALCPDPAIACDDADRANGLSNSAHNRAIGANVAFAVGGAAAIAATVLWLTGAPEAPRRVVIAPDVSAGQLGFTAGGRF